MSYCTRADLEAAIGYAELLLLADADMDGAEDLGTVDSAIADAAAQIDARIAGRWPIYVGVATPVLSGIAVDLAIERLARGLRITEEIVRRADLARSLLAAIGRGDAVPAATPGDSPAAGGDAAFIAGRRAFTGGGF